MIMLTAVECVDRRVPPHPEHCVLGREVAWAIDRNSILVQHGSGSCRRKAVFSIILAQIEVLELRR